MVTSPVRHRWVVTTQQAWASNLLVNSQPNQTKCLGFGMFVDVGRYINNNKIVLAVYEKCFWTRARLIIGGENKWIKKR